MKNSALISDPPVIGLSSGAPTSASSNKNDPIPNEIVGIQYLRGIAAIAVVVAHTAGMANFDKYFGKYVLGGYLYKGALGVDLFFLISGFIISIVSLKQGTLAPSVSLKKFLERRFARIVPLMWVAILSYAALRFTGRGVFDAWPYVRAFFLFPAGPVAPNQIWTLRHELLFYLLFGISFLLTTRRTWILGAWCVAPLVYSAFSLPAEPDTTLGQMLRIIANPVNVEFAAGFLLGLVWLLKTNRFSFTSPISPIVVLIGGFIGFTIIGYFLDLGVETVQKTLVSSAICLAILFVGVHVRCNPGWGDSLMQLFGAASFSIYLFHPHVVSACLGVWSHYAHGTPMILVIPGITAIAVLATIAVHLWIERPLVKASKQLLAKYIG